MVYVNFFSVLVLYMILFMGSSVKEVSLNLLKCNRKLESRLVRCLFLFSDSKCIQLLKLLTLFFKSVSSLLTDMFIKFSSLDEIVFTVQVNQLHHRIKEVRAAYADLTRYVILGYQESMNNYIQFRHAVLLLQCYINVLLFLRSNNFCYLNLITILSVGINQIVFQKIYSNFSLA